MTAIDPHTAGPHTTARPPTPLDALLVIVADRSTTVNAMLLLVMLTVAVVLLALILQPVLGGVLAFAAGWRGYRWWTQRG